MAELVSQKAKVEYNLGPNRPNKPDQKVIEAIQEAVTRTLGGGYTVNVISGKENAGHQHGSNRHKTGLAADVQIIDPNGKVLTANKNKQALLDVAKSFRSLGGRGIGLGTNYMGAKGIHLDMFTPGPGQTNSWGNLGKKFADWFGPTGKFPDAPPPNVGLPLAGPIPSPRPPMSAAAPSPAPVFAPVGLVGRGPALPPAVPSAGNVVPSRLGYDLNPASFGPANPGQLGGLNYGNPKGQLGGSLPQSAPIPSSRPAMVANNIPTPTPRPDRLPSSVPVPPSRPTYASLPQSVPVPSSRPAMASLPATMPAPPSRPEMAAAIDPMKVGSIANPQQKLIDAYKFMAQTKALAPVTPPQVPAAVPAPPLPPPQTIVPRPIYQQPQASAFPAAPPPPPSYTPADIYGGQVGSAKATGGNTVSRDPFGTTYVTNQYGVTTATTPDGQQAATRGVPAPGAISGPLGGQGIPTPPSGLFGSPKFGQAAKTGLGTVAGSVVGSLGGPIGSLLGAALGRELSKPGGGLVGGFLNGTKTFDTAAFGNIIAARPQNGLAFPSAPTGGIQNARESNNSMGAMRDISPAAADAIGRGLGGLY